MAQQKSTTAAASPSIIAEVFEAALRSDGAVVKGEKLTVSRAEALRKSGENVVVCGNHDRTNRNLAQNIESNANGKWKRCPPHVNAGPRALPHYQPDPRPPEGHTFYETSHRKAV